MRLSSTYFRLRQYAEALEKATNEVRNKCVDDFRAGPSLTIGKSLLLLGRFREAQSYLTGLAAEKHQGARVGSHFTYAGLAFWFDGQSERAVEHWENGLKATYQAHEGMEIPWILLYAAARRPDSYSRRRAVQLVKHYARRLNERSSTAHINAFILGRQSYDWAAAKLAGQFKGLASPQHPAVRRMIMEETSMLNFWAGVHALFDQQEERFYDAMVACASITGHELVTSELVIAECEIRQCPPKWKRRFSAWLRDNVSDARQSISCRTSAKKKGK